jgi:4-alpha-glucanotransferase
LLFPLSSVRGAQGGLGTYEDAGAVARWLRSAGCTLWQHLPLSEVSPGQDSPYAASSSCALEPVYVSLGGVEDLHAIGGEAALDAADRAALESDRTAARVDFEPVRRAKRAALRRAWAHFRDQELRTGSARAKELHHFREEHRGWLEDWGLYRVLHDRRQTSWRSWEPGLPRSSARRASCAT